MEVYYVIELSKPQRRLLNLAKTKGSVERKDNDPNNFDLLQFRGLLTSEGEITSRGLQWLSDWFDAKDD